MKRLDRCWVGTFHPMRLSSSESRVASVPRVGSTERALTRDDVSFFDVPRVRAPPFPCPVPGDPPACPCKVAPRPPPIFAPTRHHPAPGVCQLRGSTLDARRGVTFLVDSSSGPRARRRALPFWPPQLPLPAPRPRCRTTTRDPRCSVPRRRGAERGTSPPLVLVSRARPRPRRSRVPVAKRSDPNPHAPILRP
jgi:hypothetical protein